MRGNSKEIAVGTLATEKSENAEVRAYAQRLVKDHTAAQKQLTMVAQAHGIALVQEHPKINSEVDKLHALSASKFDRAFAVMALDDHQKDIVKYERASRSSAPGDLKAYVNDTLPTLKEHQAQAIKMARSAGVEQNTISALIRPWREPHAMGGARDGGIDDETDSTFSGSDEAGLKNQKGDGAQRLMDNERFLK